MEGSLRGMMLQTALIVIGIIVMVCPAIAVPVCDWQDDITECSVQEHSDFAALPTNVTSLRVYFPSGHRTVLSAKVFPLRPNLRKLVIDLNNVNKDPTGDVFSQLTALHELTVVNTDQYAPRALTLPATVFFGLRSLRIIRMVQVGLSQIDQTTFHTLPHLERLDLSNNDLTSFPGAAFTGTTKMTEIVLSNNKLSELADGTFSGLSKLQTLNLDGNKLQILNSRTFGNLPALEKLTLKNNNLRSVRLGTFQQLPLQILNLQNNKLGQIDANIFKGLSFLHTLDLSQNNLTEIADLTFTDLANLQFLEIHDNLLKRLSPMTFQGLSNLLFLDLQLNDFNEIGDDAFHDLNGLSTLHLHSANIQRISRGAFNGLTTLELLTLHGNNITTLPEGVFSGFQKLGHVDISHNPWNCTCELTWIHAWSNGQNFGNELGTQCAHTGEALLQYARDNYYICRRTTTTATIAKNTTSASLVKFSSSMDPGYMKSNGSTWTSASLNDTELILICVASAAFILAVLIAVLIIYCRKKKCAFWTPPDVAAVPSTPASAGLKKDNHFAYSPTKDQNFFGDQTGGNLDWTDKTESNRIDHHQRIDSAYDNPALHIEDNHYQNNPAVVAYISENGSAHRDEATQKLSYEHRVSDSGTHYVDRNSYPSATTDNVHLNDLHPLAVKSDIPPKHSKKGKKRKQGKKSKKPNVSSSDNGGDNLYHEIYVPSTVPTPTTSPNRPTPAPRPSLQKQHAHNTSLGSPEYDTDKDYVNQGRENQGHERASAFGVSTEEPFEGQPSTPGMETNNPLDDTPANIYQSPHNVDYIHNPEGDYGEDQSHRRLQHTDSLGINPDDVDYRHSYNEDKPLY